MANVHHNTYNDELIFAVNQLVKKALATYGITGDADTSLESRVAALEEAVEALEDAGSSGSGSGSSGGSDPSPQA